MKKVILGSAMITLFVIGAIVGIMFMAGGPKDAIVYEIERVWQPLSTGGTVGDNSGITRIVFITHAAAPATTYNSNLTGANYTWVSSLNESADSNGTVPYDTAFDIVVQVQIQDEVGYNTTGTTWELSWVTCNITCASLSISADTVMTQVNYSATADFRWASFYVNNAGNGYTIYRGQSVNITDIDLKGYYTP